MCMWKDADTPLKNQDCIFKTLKDGMKITSPDDCTFPWRRAGSTQDYVIPVT